MSRNGRIENHPETDFTPLIDVIFTVLSFFMMATVSMVAQSNLPVSLPRAAVSMGDYSDALPITVMLNGQIYFGEEELSLDLLAPRVQVELNRAPASAFILNADREVEYQEVVKVLDELKKIGVKRIAIATELS